MPGPNELFSTNKAGHFGIPLCFWKCGRRNRTDWPPPFLLWTRPQTVVWTLLTHYLRKRLLWTHHNISAQLLVTLTPYPLCSPALAPWAWGSASVRPIPGFPGETPVSSVPSESDAFHLLVHSPKGPHWQERNQSPTTVQGPRHLVISFPKALAGSCSGRQQLGLRPRHFWDPGITNGSSAHHTTALALLTNFLEYFDMIHAL